MLEYEVYRKVMSKEEFIRKIEADSLEAEMIDRLYRKYTVKCEVLNRDNFTCQNVNCKSTSELTTHHITFRVDGGKDEANNEVTLCKDCHAKFHAAKIEVVYGDSNSLPESIRGKSFRMSIRREINWKQIRKEMRTFRRNAKEHCGLRISWEQVRVLLRFLEMDFEED